MVNEQTITKQFFFSEAFKNQLKFEEVTEEKYPNISPIYIKRTLVKLPPEKIMGLKVVLEIQSE